jgi:DNA invertase Pin-like site-specific DNA recombinase
MRVAIYARVSTEDQAKEGFSLDAQVKKLETYCRTRNWTPTDHFIDEGCSGRNTNRPEYKRMMLLMDRWDVLLVLKMDRIHRNSVNFTAMMDTLKKNGKEFISFQEKFDTSTAVGRFAMDIMQRIAQLESEQIGERVKMGMERKARHGTGTLGSGHPYGYVYTDGMLLVQPDEAQTVCKIYEMSSEGRSTQHIAETLNNSGIPAKRGGIWNRQSVHKILHNPLYTGTVRWNDITRSGEHTAIIDRSLYEKVNGGLHV